MSTSEGDVFVRLTVYKDCLVITGPPPEFRHPDWVPIVPGKIGCTLVDTARHLGVSEEALAWLRDVKPSAQPVGHLMWWRRAGGGYLFAWLGKARAIKRPGADGNAGWFIPEDGFVVIPNDVPEVACQVIDAKGDA